MASYYINPEVTDYYYVCGFVSLCALITPQKMSPTQYARTVMCTDEVMCYCVWYGTVRYGTVLYCTVMYGTIPYGIVHLPYGTVPY